MGIGITGFMLTFYKGGEELGRLGASKSGKARADKLTPEQRKEIARKAAKARWDKKRREEGSS